MTASSQLDFAAARAVDLVQALAARQVSALELFVEAVSRIQAGHWAINAVVVRDFDRAREAALAADAALVATFPPFRRPRSRSPGPPRACRSGCR
jgi:amidase